MSKKMVPLEADTSSQSPLPPLEKRVSFLMHRINAHLNRLTNPMLKRWGVDLTESRLMVALLERGEMTAGEVVALMALPQSTVSHQIKRLEKLGYVKREAAAHDQRSVMTSLTEAGLKVARESNEHSRDVTNKILLAIGRDEMEAVREALLRVDGILSSD